MKATRSHRRGCQRSSCIDLWLDILAWCRPCLGLLGPHWPGYASSTHRERPEEEKHVGEAEEGSLIELGTTATRLTPISPQLRPVCLPVAVYR